MNKFCVSEIEENAAKREYETMYRNTMPNSRVLVFMTGFCLGMVYFYFVRDTLLEKVDFMSADVLGQLKNYQVKKELLISYVASLRFQQAAILMLCAGNLFAVGLFYLVLAYMGFHVSVLFFSAIYQYGMKGIIFCIVSFFPHGIFYLILFFRISNNIYKNDTKYYHNNNYIKGAGCHKILPRMLYMAGNFVLWSLGVLCESYMNPDIMQKMALLFY